MTDNITSRRWGLVQLYVCLYLQFWGFNMKGRKIIGHRVGAMLLMLSSCQVLSSFFVTMRFSRQEYWSGLPFSYAGLLPRPGIKPMCPAVAGRFFTTEPLKEALLQVDSLGLIVTHSGLTVLQPECLLAVDLLCRLTWGKQSGCWNQDSTEKKKKQP